MALRSVPLKRLVLQNSYSGLVLRLPWWETPAQPVEGLEAPACMTPFKKFCWGKSFRFWSSERKAIVQNTSSYICSVNLSSISTLLGQNCSESRKVSFEKLTENSFFRLKHGSLLIRVINHSAWASRSAGHELLHYEKDAFGQRCFLASATVIHALW